MPTDPLVSIIVPSRGGATHLSGLFEALRHQSLDDWEAVVVLDGDIDNSEAVVRHAARELPIRLVVFEANRGRSAALNAGFREASGEVLVRCDDDMVPDPDYVRNHAATHDGARVGVVGLSRNIFPDTAYARAYGRRWDEEYRRDAYNVAAAGTWHYWAGNCSVTRASWDSIGPYDTAFRSYGWEDVDWGYRLSKTGVPIVIERSLEVDHLGPAATASRRAQRAFYAGAAKRRFEAKHALTTTQGPGNSAWDRAVMMVQQKLNEERIVRLGSLLDRSAAALPRPISHKAIALLIEASSMAGHRASATHGEI